MAAVVTKTLLVAAPTMTSLTPPMPTESLNSPFKLAFLHPTYWPEVRRGSERLIHDLGAGLAARGHRVTLFTSHTAAASRSHEDGIEVVRSRRPPPLRALRWYEDHLSGGPQALWHLRGADFDLAHAFFPVDGWAAVQARRHFGGPPVVVSLHGIPIRQYLVERRYRLDMLRTAVDGAAELTVLSDAAALPTRRYLLRQPTVLPGGVRVADFAVDQPRAEAPTIVCAAGIHEPRKRGDLLLEAFELLRRSVPDARLVLVRPRDPLLSAWETPQRPEGVSWVDGSDGESLARTYAAASVSVLAAVDEAFGLVIVESLAAGTPVVAAHSGACPEIVADDSYGRLFNPDDPVDLARALGDGLALGRDPATVAACRNRAADFDLERTLDIAEQVYARAVGPRA